MSIWLIGKGRVAEGWQAAYFDGSTFGGVDTAGFDGRNNGAVCSIGDSIAIHPCCAGTVGQCEILIFSDESRVLEGRLDVEFAILYEDVFRTRCSLFEFAVPVTMVSVIWINSDNKLASTMAVE